jgi:hypothetical protein
MNLLPFELTGGMREELSKALLSAFPKDELDRFVKFAFDWELHEFTAGSPQQRVDELVQRVESEGRVRRLLRRAEWKNSGNLRLRALLDNWKLLRVFQNLSLLKRLHGLLLQGELAPGVLEETWSTVAGSHALAHDWWDLPPEGQLIELLECLAELEQPPSALHPLLQFVARLGQHKEAPPHLGALLRDWLKQAGPPLRISPAALDSLWSSVEQASSRNPLFLLVKIDLQGPETYCIKAWLSDAMAQECDVIFGGDGRPYALSALHSQVQSLLEGVRKRHRKRLLEAHNELTLEFFLPRALLCYPLDSILIEGGASEPVPIGIQHGVVVRSADRLDAERGSHGRLHWELRWQSFRSAPQDPARRLLLSKAFEGEAERKKFDARLTRPHAFPFALGLMLSPPAVSPVSQQDPLSNWVIRTGIPIALWLQEGASLDESLLSDFERLLENVSDLPRLVRERRHQGFAEESRLGKHLTLFWDDPERLPPEYREDLDLEAPTEQG